MKHTMLLLICYTGMIHVANAQLLADSLSEEPITIKQHRFNFVITFIELGKTIPLKEKHLQSLPHGMDAFLSQGKSSWCSGFLGAGVYYKNRLGVSVLLSGLNYVSGVTEFRNYLTNQFPDHYNYITNDNTGHDFSISSWSYRIGYRFHKDRFQIEPQFQIGKFGNNSSHYEIFMKEKGSNHFILYSIKGENKSKNSFYYRAGIAATWRPANPTQAWEFETGLRFDLLFIPTEFNYQITIDPYQMPSTMHEVRVKQWYPAFMLSFVVSALRK